MKVAGGRLEGSEVEEATMLECVLMREMECCEGITGNNMINPDNSLWYEGLSSRC